MSIVVQFVTNCHFCTKKNSNIVICYYFYLNIFFFVSSYLQLVLLMYDHFFILSMSKHRVSNAVIALKTLISYIFLFSRAFFYFEKHLLFSNISAFQNAITL